MKENLSMTKYDFPKENIGAPFQVLHKQEYDFFFFFQSISLMLPVNRSKYFVYPNPCIADSECWKYHMRFYHSHTWKVSAKKMLKNLLE